MSKPLLIFRSVSSVHRSHGQAAQWQSYSLQWRATGWEHRSKGIRQFWNGGRKERGSRGRYNQILQPMIGRCTTVDGALSSGSREHQRSAHNSLHTEENGELTEPEILTLEISPMELALHDTPVQQQPEDRRARQREESLAMVDLYEEIKDDGASATHPRSSVNIIVDELQQPIPPGSAPASVPKPKALVVELEGALDDKSTTIRDIYQSYTKLPHPGAKYLSRPRINQLLKRLGHLRMDEKDEVAMLQYLSVFDDMHAAGLQPSSGQWATAMHLTGRYARRVTMSELDNTMRIWRRMERDAGIISDTVTMNILLDVASKSGHYALAEFVLREMQTRRISFDRYTRLGIIYLNGCKEDGEGIRSAYKDFVNANELVDSMALTCVITALLKAGELPAAMNVYQRMLAKALPEYRDDGAPESVRSLGRVIAKYSKQYAGDRTMMERLQKKISLAPNVITYISLIRHHAQRTGELLPIAKLLDEMHSIGVALHGQIFIELFHGFAMHGDKLYTSWTAERLQDVWQAFCDMVDQKAGNVYVGPVMAAAVIKAFFRCCGRQQALVVIEDLKKRWNKREGQREEPNEDWLEVASRSS